ncbi:DUF3509 domain-containing protein [Pseudomonas sp. ML96]|uniref:DUF3509 domain-containing protein n=1 Tax=Pseudomonas sp. ML96 TaxID=1523503 RepID=UPI0005B92418|nr:DUF3509 domain-containing protein [Pseudomonas sp. ML96]
MQLAIKEFFDAFPAHKVSIAPRPDGMLLLTLRKPNEVPLSKAIDSAAIFNRDSVRELIFDVTLSLKLANGQSIDKGDGDRWGLRDLPTFTGNPIHITASRMLVHKRKLELMRKQSREAVAV